MATNFEPHKCVIYVQTTKICTHQNKAIHSTSFKETEPLIHTLGFNLQLQIRLTPWDLS